MNIDSLERRVESIIKAYPRLPSYDEFVEWWSNADELSKSLFECALSCTGIIDEDWKFWQTVKSYLQKIGIPAAETSSIEEIAKQLKSDD